MFSGLIQTPINHNRADSIISYLAQKQQAADQKPAAIFVKRGIYMTKLPHGITQRKDGLYIGRFQYQGVRYSVTDKDLKKCTNKLEKLTYEIKNNIYCRESNVTVNSWFYTWLEEYKKPNVKPNTVDTYSYIYNSHIKKHLGSKQLKNVRPDMIQKLYNSMKKNQFSNSTLKLTVVVLHNMFEQAYKNGMILKNPVTLVPTPKVETNNTARAMELEEQKLFIKYAENSDIYDICEIFLYTGLRSGELRGLEWKDIDFNKKLIHVTGTLYYSKETGWRKGKPKTKTSKRDIPMLDNVEHLLKKRKRQQMENKLYLGDKFESVKGFENLVFTRSNGSPIKAAVLNYKLNRIQEQIRKDGNEIERITPHTLRHTFATRCIENGIPPQVLKVILGHSTLAMTMDLYAHVLPNTRTKEMQKIANIFGR